MAGRTRAGELVTADWFTVTLTGPREVGRSAEVHLEDLRDLTELREEIRPELLGDAEDAWDLADRIEAAWAAGLPLLPDTPGPLLAASAREVERLREEAAQVTELDLAAHRALWQNPEGVLDFTALRRLRLAGRSSPGRLLPRLAELAYLEELDISGMALEELPEAIARLPRLKVLDISGNPFRALPDRLGGFTGLRVLRARDLCCSLPHTLSRLPALEELDLSGLQPAPADRLDNDPYLVPFPRIVTRLPALRSLNLYGAVLDSVPDGLLRATALEELDLGGALGRVESLPELSRLPRLRTLRMNGNAGNADRAPAPHLLDRVWEVTTLEELALDCWGEETCRDPRTGRYDTLGPPLTLPDDAFARMPRLRVLNLEFSRPTTLPESFYALTALEDVQVDFSALDAPTRQRLASLARSEPDNPARDWISALQARLLLKAGRHDDAYRLTERILTRRPGFRGLAGIVGTADYRTWRDRAAGQ
ncbi:leucine-rich repeat domain-containing protein [Streptomyces sp. NPDC047917]|uniref:leucine-rich repeat domain-containing protein n=1 Tax=Streptomyces sp. NPDC047917 TaxID=3365491 RepID=UPI003717817C